MSWAEKEGGGQGEEKEKEQRLRYKKKIIERFPMILRLFSSGTDGIWKVGLSLLGLPNP